MKTTFNNSVIQTGVSCDCAFLKIDHQTFYFEEQQSEKYRDTDGQLKIFTARQKAYWYKDQLDAALNRLMNKKVL